MAKNLALAIVAAWAVHGAVPAADTAPADPAPVPAFDSAQAIVQKFGKPDEIEYAVDGPPYEPGIPLIFGKKMKPDVCRLLIYHLGGTRVICFEVFQDRLLSSSIVDRSQEMPLFPH